MNLLIESFWILLISICCISIGTGDQVSIGVSTCTKLNDDGDPMEFMCPDSLSLGKHYCCGVRNFQYCCDFDDHEAFSEGAVAAIIIGSLLVTCCCLGTLCWCCSCLCFSTSRPQHIILTQPATVTTSQQPIFVPQGYYQFGTAQVPNQSATNQGFNQAPESFGKPPPYNN